MTTVENKEHAVPMTPEEWLAIRKEAGLRIDPATAKVACWYAQLVDPYGIYPDDPDANCVVRQEFARAPESDVWVNFVDLPKATVAALRERRNVDEDVFDEDLPF
jgi:hypothetical protein